jgi:hypothetical protein
MTDLFDLERAGLVEMAGIYHPVAFDGGGAAL